MYRWTDFFISRKGKLECNFQIALAIYQILKGAEWLDSATSGTKKNFSWWGKKNGLFP